MIQLAPPYHIVTYIVLIIVILNIYSIYGSAWWYTKKHYNKNHNKQLLFFLVNIMHWIHWLQFDLFRDKIIRKGPFFCQFLMTSSLVIFLNTHFILPHLIRQTPKTDTDRNIREDTYTNIDIGYDNNIEADNNLKK